MHAMKKERYVHKYVRPVHREEECRERAVFSQLVFMIFDFLEFSVRYREYIQGMVCGKAGTNEHHCHIQSCLQCCIYGSAEYGLHDNG